MNDPNKKLCPKCVGSGIAEVGVMKRREMCRKCDGTGFVEKKEE